MGSAVWERLVQVSPVRSTAAAASSPTSDLQHPSSLQMGCPEALWDLQSSLQHQKEEQDLIYFLQATRGLKDHNVAALWPSWHRPLTPTSLQPCCFLHTSVNLCTVGAGENYLESKRPPLT